MFCSSCGNQISDQEKFCKFCGKPVEQINNQPKTAPAVTASNGSDVIGELDRMTSYLVQKQAQYDEYDKCIANIRYLSNPRNKVKVKAGISGIPFIVGGAVLAPNFIAFFLMCLFAYSWVKADTPGHQVDTQATVMFFSIAIIGTLISIAAIVVGIILNIRRKKKYAEARASMSKQNEDRVNVLIGELAACYNQYGSGVVSSLYSNPKILAKIRQIIASGNAYTVNDAVNLMHQYSGNSAAQLQAAMPIQPVSFFTADSFK